MMLLWIFLFSLSVVSIIYFWGKLKEKKPRGFTFISFMYLVSCLMLGMSVGRMIGLSIPKGFTTEKTVKQYIIENRNELQPVKWDSTITVFVLDTIKMNYWQDATIKYFDCDSAHIIFWGDRNSKWWKYRLDKSFMIKHGDTLDDEILDILNTQQIIL